LIAYYKSFASEVYSRRTLVKDLDQLWIDAIESINASQLCL